MARIVINKNDFENSSMVGSYFRTRRPTSLVLKYHIRKEED